MTRNPWDLEQGASGSSAGSAAAVAAGAVAFSIGSETLGSIVSPSGRCGTSGLRPTFGRVSRHGAMSLAPSMDKLGPIARSADDCAIAFGAIGGPDGRDETVVDVPFAYPGPASLAGRRIGVVEAAFERQPAARGVVDELRALGAEVVPVALPDAPYDELWLVHEAEPAAMFDDLTRSGRLAEMARQEEKSWPVVFRSARLIPAVEFVRAGRIRRLLMGEMDQLMRDLDLLVHPTEDDACMTLENLTGHPAVAMPWGADEAGRPGSVTFAGHLDGEMDLLGLARAWQETTGHHLRRPPL
jgi:Asp-tRNA(Asn)/Glu-tRNA(Gln) amidotransferase A subunit family amidase